MDTLPDVFVVASQRRSQQGENSINLRLSLPIITIVSYRLENDLLLNLRKPLREEVLKERLGQACLTFESWILHQLL